MKKRYWLFLLFVLVLGMATSCQFGDAAVKDHAHTTDENSVESAHIHNYLAEVVKPTCTAEGYTRYSCAECGDSYTGDVTPLASHRYSKELHTPDRENGGYTVYTCLDCQATYTDDYSEPVDFSVGLAYTKQSNGYYVSGIGSCKETNLEIPALSEQGYKVVGILKNAFVKSEITSVTVEKGVTDIQENAFSECLRLTSIVFPAATVVQEDAFSNLPALTYLEMSFAHPLAYYFAHRVSGEGNAELVQGPGPEYNNVYGKIPVGLTEIHAVGKLSNYVFSDCVYLTKVTVDPAIKKLPAYAFDGCTALSELSYSEQLTSIGGGAFKECMSLSNLEIPETVTYIGGSAFQGMTIISAVLPKNLALTHDEQSIFRDCKNLTHVTLPAASKIVPSYMFFGCSALEEIVIPEGVTDIGGSVFYGSSVERIVVPATVRKIGTYAFSCETLRSVELSEGVTDIDYGAFQGCVSLQSLELPDSIKAIGHNAFEGCTMLKTVTLPGQLQELGDEAFLNCTALETVELPDTLTTLAQSLFEGCTSLRSLNIPYGVTVIPHMFATGCTSLSSVTLPETVTTIGSNAFAGCSIVSMTIPESVTELVDGIFFNCSLLETLVLPSKIEILPSSLCSGCVSLRRVTLPTQLTIIKDRAFYGCASLEEVVLPPTLKALNQEAFRGCSSLRTVDFSEASPSAEGVRQWNAVFADCTSLTEVKNQSFLVDFSSGLFQNTPLQTVRDGLTIALGCVVEADPAVVLEVVYIPEGVTGIAGEVFRRCGHIKEMILPEGVTHLGSRIFGDSLSNSQLTRLVLPDSLVFFRTDTISGLPHFQELEFGKNLTDIPFLYTPFGRNGITLRFRGTREEFYTLPWTQTLDLSGLTVICTDEAFLIPKE